jgi:hypothetical protein
LPIFCEKNGIKKNNVMIRFLQKLAVVWAKNAHIRAQFFGENIFKILTSLPVPVFETMPPAVCEGTLKSRSLLKASLLTSIVFHPELTRSVARFFWYVIPKPEKCTR